MRFAARYSLVVVTFLSLAACRQEPMGPPQEASIRISHGVGLWADEDCYQLTICYRGFSSAEAQQFLNAVNGGGFGTGLSSSELATCDGLKSLLNLMHGRGDTGIWTDVWMNWDAISNWTGSSARSATHAGFEGDSYLWYHEAAHIYFNTDNEAVAESWGNRCRRS